MSYTRNDPKWVQAESVEAAVSDASYVNVKAYGEEFTMCRVEWNDPHMNKQKSDVLVKNQQGDWLRVWFFDKDVKPFQNPQQAEEAE